jgi:hypothetical protein
MKESKVPVGIRTRSVEGQATSMDKALSTQILEPWFCCFLTFQWMTTKCFMQNDPQITSISILLIE